MPKQKESRKTFLPFRHEDKKVPFSKEGDCGPEVQAYFRVLAQGIYLLFF